MTLIDVFFTLPMWGQIIITLLAVVWCVEIFLLPFKLNFWYKMAKSQCDVVNQILQETTINKKEAETTRKLLTLFMDILGSKKPKNKDE